MNLIGDVTACVVDYGTFIAVAERLARDMKKVYYYSPFSQEYQDIRDCIQGAGLDQVERLDYIFLPEKFDEIDLWVFPDIGYGDLQQYLRREGKAVWGHFGANEIEVYRTLFLDTLKEVGLPMVHNEEIVGLTALNEYLSDPENENKWVKVNRFRNNMDTFHHVNYERSQRTLDSLAVIFGGAREQIVFIVQDDIETDGELGYDGWCIDGQYPPEAFFGWEKKNELYLGFLRGYNDLPEGVIEVNRAMSLVWKRYGYRSWLATEIREKDGVPYFIDATPRLAGQTMEHQLETCVNFSDVIWRGANGELISPDFDCKVAAEATLHYHGDTKDPTIVDEWKMLHIPEKVADWVKLYHYCKIDGDYHFPVKNTDEVGVAIGCGDTVEEALQHLGMVLDALKDEPVTADVSGFASLLKSAERAGLGLDLPRPEEIYRYKGLGR